MHRKNWYFTCDHTNEPNKCIGNARRRQEGILKLIKNLPFQINKTTYIWFLKHNDINFLDMNLAQYFSNISRWLGLGQWLPRNIQLRSGIHITYVHAGNYKVKSRIFPDPHVIMNLGKITNNKRNYH